MRAKAIFFLFFLTFFLANSSNWTLREIMWPIKFAMLALFVGYVLVELFNRQTTLQRAVPIYPLLSLAFFSLINLFSLFTLRSSWKYARILGIEPEHGYALLLGFILIYLFAMQLARFLAPVRYQAAFLSAMNSAAALVTFSNLLLYALGINLGRGADAGLAMRFSGWLDNPNTLGVILLGAFPFVLISALRSKGALDSIEWILLFSMLVLTLLTGSRSAALGMSVIAVLFVWHVSGSARSALFFTALTIGILTVLQDNAGDLLSYFPQFAREGKDILSGRSEAWKLGWKLFTERPFQGYGIGSEQVIIAKLMPPDAVHQGINFHNSYLSLLVMGGLPGAVPFFLLLGAAMKNALRILTGETYKTGIFDLLMSTLFCGLFFHAFFESWIFAPGSVYGVIFWTACFWLLSGRQVPVEAGKKRQRQISGRRQVASAPASCSGRPSCSG
ncbi:MAG: O-antigen ligase family protein [Candidatus Electrothrix sp. YB6]